MKILKYVSAFTAGVVITSATPLLFAGNTNAAEPTLISFDSVEVNPGNQVDVPVYLENNTGFNVFMMEWHYNDSVMKLLSVEEEECPVTYHDEDGRVMLFGKTDEEMTDSEYQLCTLTFEVSEQAELGDYPLLFDAGGVGLNSESVDANFENGSIFVTDEDLVGKINGLFTPSPMLIAGKMQANANGMVYVPISVKNNSGFDALSMQIKYDKSILTHCAAYDMSDYLNIAETDAGLQLTLKDKKAYEDNDTLCVLCFDVAGNAALQEYALEITDLSLAANGKAIDCNKADGAVMLVDGEPDILSGEGVHNNVRYQKSSDHVIVIGLYESEETAQELAIPSEIEGLPVTEIADYAFAFEDSIKKTVLPDSLTKIGDGAFLLCSGLTEAAIPSAVTTIGADAFNMCSNVKSFTIPASVTEIGVNAFLDDAEVVLAEENQNFVLEDKVLFNTDKTRLLQFMNKQIESFTVPESVKSIDMYAFYNMPALKSVKLPSAFTTLEEGVFTACSALQEVALPDTITSIGAKAFNSTALSEITIPAAVETIGEDAFDDCLNMKAIHVCEGNTHYMDADGILYDYAQTELIKMPADYSADSLVLPATVRKVCENACSNQAHIVSVELPDATLTVAANAFENCSKLASIKSTTPFVKIEGIEWTISNGETEDGDAVFDGVIYGCKNSRAAAYAAAHQYQFEAVDMGKKMKGDVNLDSTITVADAVLLARIVAEDSTLELDAQSISNADINGNSQIEPEDTTAVLKLLAGLL